MALVIEDGSLPVGANSFVTVEEVRAFANARALTVPAEDAAIEAACIASADYVRGIEWKFQGDRISVDQALSWPRYSVSIYGFSFPSDDVPQSLKDGCCQLSVEAAGGVDLQPTISGRSTIKEKVGPLEVQYSDGGATDGQSRHQAAEAFFLPLFKQEFQKGSGSGSGRTLRI